MNKFLAAAVILGVISAPALAKSRHAQRSPVETQGQQAYAGVQSRGDHRGVSRHSSNPAHDVYRGNQYVGSDPDPFIREKLFWESMEERD